MRMDPAHLPTLPAIRAASIEPPESPLPFAGWHFLAVFSFNRGAGYEDSGKGLSPARGLRFKGQTPLTGLARIVPNALPASLAS